MLSFLRFLPVALFLLVPPASSGSENSDSFSAWVDALRQEAIAVGIRQEVFNKVFVDLQPIPQVIKFDRNQPEFKQSLEQYLTKRITPEKIAQGRRLLSLHSELLDEIFRKYGVEPRFLIALWSIETNYGSITGEYPTIAALATLAHDGRRSSFFRNEVLAALRVVNKGLLSPEQMKGSWAGAIGQLQFLPSVYLQFGVDFNENGRIDVWKEVEDVFASGANYLKESGWRRDEGWGTEIEASVGNRHSAIVQPDGPEGRSFLVYNNYEVLLKWNRSHLFAVCVCLFADELQVDM